MMFQSVGLLVFNLLLLATEATADKILPPQNLSLRWTTPFRPELSWEPPKQSATGCTFMVYIEPKNDENGEYSPRLTGNNYSLYKIMDGGYLHWSVHTFCNGSKSEEAVYNVNYPELVTDLVCYGHTDITASCSWSQKNDTRDLRFFYRLENRFGEEDDKELRECSYNTTGVQSSCDLWATSSNAILIFLNGTWSSTSVMNTFKRDTITHVKPPPLKWKVTDNGKERFNISWVAPKALSSWKYIVSYTECNMAKNLHVEESASYYELNRIPRCEYCISVVAFSDKGSTPPSTPMCFDADENGGYFVYFALIIPLVFAFMAAFAFICYRKHKDVILPKIPQPRILFDDISNNNESSNLKLQRPTDEEVICRVTLLADTQSDC